MYKKILVPIDGSSKAKRGLAEAIRLAKHHKAKVRLIHVVDVFIVTPTLESGRYVEDIQKSFREDGRRLLKNAEALVRKHGIAVDSVMFEIVGSQAAEIIVEQARKWRADIIVIGTHGRRGVLRLVMGSDAEEVVRTSPVPVLLVRPKRSSR
jgi:nucleotide-binding universal stress UspA family protein